MYSKQQRLGSAKERPCCEQRPPCGPPKKGPEPKAHEAQRPLQDGQGLAPHIWPAVRHPVSLAHLASGEIPAPRPIKDPEEAQEQEPEPWTLPLRASTGTMNSSSSSSFLLTLLLLASVAAAAPMGSDPPTSCCFTFTARKIPRGHVVDYYETNSRCSQPAVVFITRKRREICSDPAERWVQEYVNDLELN